MGLAASQAKLLNITARMHDVELKSQYVMNEKVELATREDRAYDEYCAALDAKKLQIKVNNDGKLNFVDASYASVCGYNPDRTGTYAIRDANSGCMIVDPETYKVYQAVGSGNKYEFAMQMLGFTEDELSEDGVSFGLVGVSVRGMPEEIDAEITDYKYSGTFKDKSTDTYSGYAIMTDTEAAVYEAHIDYFKDYMQAISDAADKGDEEEVSKAINEFREELYNKFSSEIYSGVRSAVGATDMSDFDTEMADEFQYYIQIYEGIEASGGCITDKDFVNDGDTGKDWFNNLISSGKAMICQYNTTGTKKGTWSEISVSTSPNLKEVPDEIAIKKAEAKYQHELRQINKKDADYDQELKKLETEETALKTEIDSIKKVKDDNIERTFGIFS